jgi:cytochrome c-type biogenesis protein CcmH/NrfG
MTLSPPVAIHDAPDTAMTTRVEVLREQWQQAQQEKACFLAVLEAEQQARRDLETKLLPAPKPARTGKVRVWALVVLLAAALAFAGWWFRAAILGSAHDSDKIAR